MFNGNNGPGNSNIFGELDDPLTLSWSLFEKSGAPEFYLLYKNLFRADPPKKD